VEWERWHWSLRGLFKVCSASYGWEVQEGSSEEHERYTKNDTEMQGRALCAARTCLNKYEGICIFVLNYTLKGKSTALTA
jgi:hypothetical protein